MAKNMVVRQLGGERCRFFLCVVIFNTNCIIHIVLKVDA